MPNTANLNVRIDPELKAQAENLFADLGMSLMETLRQKMTDFIHNIYLDISEEEKTVFRHVITQLHQRLFPEDENQKEK